MADVCLTALILAANEPFFFVKKPNELSATADLGAHPAMQKTWWVNLYQDGQITSALCKTREEALNRCTYTGDTPDAIQVEVRLVPLNE